MTEQEEDRQRWWMSRRAFLSSGAVGAAAVALGGAVPADAKSATNDVDAMVLQVATVAAVYPVRVKTRQGKPAVSQLQASSVAQAWKRCSAKRAEQARRGAQLLLDRRLGGADAPKLLRQLGALAAKGSDADVADLRALVSVAAATTLDHIDPDEDVLATLWLGGLANKYRREGALTGGTSS